MILQALNDNSLAVVRAMRRFRSETEQEKVERVVTSYHDGSFLIDRLEAGLVVDQDLAVVLLDLRRRLIDEHGDTPVNRPSESNAPPPLIPPTVFAETPLRVDINNRTDTSQQSDPCSSTIHQVFETWFQMRRSQ